MKNTERECLDWPGEEYSEEHEQSVTYGNTASPCRHEGEHIVSGISQKHDFQIFYSVGKVGGTEQNPAHHDEEHYIGMRNQCGKAVEIPSCNFFRDQTEAMLSAPGNEVPCRAMPKTAEQENYKLIDKSTSCRYAVSPKRDV